MILLGHLFICFCILTLNYVTLLCLLVLEGSFCFVLVDSFGDLLVCEQSIFIYSFSIYTLFISFSCLLALARTSSMTLKRNGEKGHLNLVPDLYGKALSYSPLIMMLVVAFLKLFFIYLRQFPSILSLLSV